MSIFPLTSPWNFATIGFFSPLTLSVASIVQYSSGINEKSLKYKWTDHNIEPDINDSDWMPIKDGQEIENKKEKYLWIYGEDNAGNFTLYSSGENEIGLMIDDIESKCDKWMNKDIQLTVKSTMTLFNINESFEIFMMSSSFSQEELKKMEKIQDNNDHLLTIDKEGKHTIYLTKLKDGKECRAMKLDIWIDKTKPTAPEILISDNKENDKYYEGAVVTIEDGKDDLSGVKETNIEIKDKDGKNVDVSDKTKFKLSNLGIYTVKATTFDNAGNSSSTEKKVEIIKKEDNSKSDNNSNNNQIIRFDWAMKRLLRNKANFSVLEGLLTTLPGEKIVIQKLLESESNQEDKFDK